MEKTFCLKNITIKTFDDEYDTWSTYCRDMIITQRGDYETYIGNDRIFKTYESLIEEWNNRSKKYPTLKFEKPLIEIDTLICVYDQEDVEHLKRIMNIEGESNYAKSIYQRVKCYGGAEEGGWYYHKQFLVDEDSNDYEIGTDRYGQGFIEEFEFYRGQNEMISDQYYC